MSRRSIRKQRRKERQAAEPAARVDLLVPNDADLDHHLWKNGRLWWVAFTVHQGHQQERIRLSLGTDDLAEARRKRDWLLALYAAAEECQVSLRFQPRRQHLASHRRQEVA